MHKWDVALLAYPFTDLSATKVRPALIISPDPFNQTGQDLVVISITTNTTLRNQFEFLLQRSHPEFPQTGLRFDSAVRIGKVFTLNKSLFVRTLGQFGAQLRSEVDKRLRLFFALPPDQLRLPFEQPPGGAGQSSMS